MTILELFADLLPSWLGGANAPAAEPTDDGVRVVASLALVQDDYLARVKQGLVARFPAYAPDDDALSALGRDRVIIRGIGEPAAAYAARLSRAFDDHRRRGSPMALLAQIAAYLQAPCVLRTVDRRGNWYTRLPPGTTPPAGSFVDDDGAVYVVLLNRGNWNWDTRPAAEWARFWLIIYPVGGTVPWAPSGTIGSPTLWGTGKIGNPGRTIGTTATPDQVAAVRSIVREWKPAGTRCEWIIIAFDSSAFDPSGTTDPAGEWGTWGNGAGQPVRLASARYWSGS